MRKFMLLCLIVICSACASNPYESFSWEDGMPDEHYQFALFYEVDGEWTERQLTNEQRVNCVHDELWRSPITAVRLTNRESGDVVREIDCTQS